MDDDASRQFLQLATFTVFLSSFPTNGPIGFQADSPSAPATGTRLKTLVAAVFSNRTLLPDGSRARCFHLVTTQLRENIAPRATCIAERFFPSVAADTTGKLSSRLRNNPTNKELARVSMQLLGVQRRYSPLVLCSVRLSWNLGSRLHETVINSIPLCAVLPSVTLIVDDGKRADRQVLLVRLKIGNFHGERYLGCKSSG